MISPLRMHLATSFWVLLLAPAAVAQSATPAPGHRLFGDLRGPETWLADANQQVVHTWTAELRPGVSVYLATDGTLYRTIQTQTPPAGGGGGGLQRWTLDGQLLWDFRYDGPGVLSHHDIEIMPNGNVLMIAWEEFSKGQAIKAGRDPALIGDVPFLPDKIIEVMQTGPSTGEVVWEWRVWDHLIQDHDPTKNNYGDVASHPELIDINYPRWAPNAGDWNHMNAVNYDPLRDWIVMSAREQSEIWIIRHSAPDDDREPHVNGGPARSRTGLIYRWGNPEAYRAGGPEDRQLRGQHGSYIIPEGLPGAGNMLVFNNQHIFGTEVWELDLPGDDEGRFPLLSNGTYGPPGPMWTYGDPAFRSLFVSNCERLPNGNTLVCSGLQGWVFEVGLNDQVVWEARSPNGSAIFHAHYYEHYLWADRREISVSQGGSVRFDLIPGTQHAGEDYWLFGSMSGTRPGVDLDGNLLPLNPDPYLFLTLTQPNGAPFADNLGSIGPSGRVSATFTLPGGILPPDLEGIRMNHAFAVLGLDGVTKTSHPITLDFVR